MSERYNNVNRKKRDNGGIFKNILIGLLALLVICSTALNVYMFIQLKGRQGNTSQNQISPEKVSNISIDQTTYQSASDTQMLMNAYSKGWTYWFSGWGSHHEGLQYTNQYYLGRKYGNSFESTFDAFKAGYNDAFFYCNNHDPGDSHELEIEQGYEDYFGDE